MISSSCLSFLDFAGLSSVFELDLEESTVIEKGGLIMLGTAALAPGSSTTE